MIPAWVGHYIGLRFSEEFTCWTLLREVYRAEFGIDVPSYAGRYTSTRDAEGIAPLVGEEASAHWREVPVGAVLAPDALVFRFMGQPMHVGVVIAPGWFLHVMEGHDAPAPLHSVIALTHRIEAFHNVQEPSGAGASSPP